MAKYSPNAATQIYLTILSGSNSDQINAIAVNPNGEVYAAGTTASADFPVTADSYSTLPPNSGTQAFAVKLNASGKEQYGTFLTGTGSATDIAVDSAGNVIVTGATSGKFPTTPGFLGNAACSDTSFVMKLDPTLAHPLFAGPCLGGVIAVDSKDNIYVAGTAFGGGGGLLEGAIAAAVIPITKGAFQTSIEMSICSSVEYSYLYCNPQFVAKFDATGTKLIFCTYLTGGWGAKPSVISIDAAGNVIISGTTPSSDYPTTPGAVERYYPAQGFQPLIEATCIYTTNNAPPTATGYISKLSADGSSLLFSTYLGGRSGDTVTALFVDGESIYAGGSVSSPDFPGLAGIPSQCLPSSHVTRLDPNAATVLKTTIAEPTGPMAMDPSGRFIIASSAYGIGRLNQLDLSTPSDKISCIRDAADLGPIVDVVPGQLVSIFGSDFFGRQVPYIAPNSPTTSLKSQGSSFQVTLDNTPAPLLYVSSGQINLQVPYEIAGKPNVTLMLSTDADSSLLPQESTRILQVGDRAPAFFSTASPLSLCGYPWTYFGLAAEPVVPAIWNQDGTLNSCSNPAAFGSTVTAYVQGLGVTAPPLLTGQVNGSSVPLNEPVALSQFGVSWPSWPVGDPNALVNITSLQALPGSISSVWEIQLEAMRNPGGCRGLEAFQLTPLFGSTPTRESILVWLP